MTKWPQQTINSVVHFFFVSFLLSSSSSFRFFPFCFLSNFHSLFVMWWRQNGTEWHYLHCSKFVVNKNLLSMGRADYAKCFPNVCSSFLSLSIYFGPHARVTYQFSRDRARPWSFIWTSALTTPGMKLDIFSFFEFSKKLRRKYNVAFLVTVSVFLMYIYIIAIVCVCWRLCVRWRLTVCVWKERRGNLE